MRLLFVFVLLSGCAGLERKSYNLHTDVHTTRSSIERVDWSVNSRLEVRALRLERNGTSHYALLTFVTRGDLNYPSIRSVWSFGQQLPYERLDRRRVGLDRQEAGASYP